MSGIEHIRALLQQSDMKGSKSTAMSALAWLIAVLVAALTACLKLSTPDWILRIIVALLTIAVLIYMGLYVFLAIKAPDALRSEKYSLSKMAIEKSFRGDNLTGIVDPTMILIEGIVPDAPRTPNRELGS